MDVCNKISNLNKSLELNVISKRFKKKLGNCKNQELKKY